MNMNVKSLSTKKLITGLVFAASFVSGASQANALFSLENLERERAAMLSAMTDTSLDINERQSKVAMSFKRMVDIERMVLRDERIAQSDKLIVKKAFDNYDLTFLAHASTEANRDVYSHWLRTLNITAETIERSEQGTR